jgi:single-strand DNA-binding protein
MLNKVMLIGNVGRDPEVRYLDNGVAKATFSLATSETYKNKDGSKTTQTEWHNIVLWRALAEIAEKYIKKGDRLYIEGKIHTRSYDDKDGQKKFITEITGDGLQMLGGRPKGESGESVSLPDSVTEEPLVANEGDDLPF